LRRPWSAVTCDCGVATVVPPASAFGWLTLVDSEITTFSEPCVTAAARTRKPSAMTTVPVRELNTTFGASSPTRYSSLPAWP
jgi:hypothetical protein